MSHEAKQHGGGGGYKRGDMGHYFKIQHAILNYSKIDTDIASKGKGDFAIS